MADGTATRGADVFSEFSAPVREALSERGFTTPTEPQRRAIPPLAHDRNALVIAPTGTGKTETAMLPVFDAIAESDFDDSEREGFSALYITPLRALNRDMRDRLTWWGETLDIDIDVRHGDTTQYQRRQQAEDPPDVLVTTPETLQAMLTGSKLRKALAGVDHVVVDEVHELAAAKRGVQLSVALERLQVLAGSFQRIGLSATVGSPTEVARFLTGDRSFEVIEIDAGSAIEFSVHHPTVTQKDEQLSRELATDETIASHVRVIRDIVSDHSSTLIFVNTRQTAEALGSRFKKLGEPIEVHHGSLSKDVRIDVEDRFKNGSLDGLVCTSSMELGIDVGEVDHVVQYGSPREVARLLQRAGRAGHHRDRISHGTVITSSPDDTLEALAIARRATEGIVEPARIHHASLDTVANQIIGIVMDEGEVSARRAYQIVTAAYPFANLDKQTFREVIRELSSNRLVWLEEDADRLEKSSGTWQYFYANLSMIPDEETYDVYDMSSRGQIGTLDERFVLNFAEPGAAFIQRGEMWRINDIDDDETQVNVTPIEDPSGEVPSWTGAEIPVPAHVANEVGEMRAAAAKQLATGANKEAVGRDLARRYPADVSTITSAIEPIERQIIGEYPIPTADRLVIEAQAQTVVINSPHGHRINETLGRLLAALVGQRTGASVGLDVSPYRIELELPRQASIGDVTAVFDETDPMHVEAILELALKKADALKFTLAQVAAKFGALKRYQGRERFGGDRLMAALEDTPVYDEAVREVFHTDLAVPETTALLERYHTDELTIATTRERTPIGVDGRSHGKELLVPSNADAGVIEAVRDRIQDDNVRLLCLHCTDWEQKKPVRRVRDQPRCPRCEATRIACLNPWDEDTPKAVRGGTLEEDTDADRLQRRAHRSASLIQSHGKQAAIALAARGVGPQTAARIIGNLREDETEFYRDILKQEQQYARTQSFWD